MAKFEQDIAVCFILEEVLVFANIDMFHRPVDFYFRLKLLSGTERVSSNKFRS